MANGKIVIPWGTPPRPIKLVDLGDGTYAVATSGGGGGGGSEDVNVTNASLATTSPDVVTSLGLPADAAWSGTGDAGVIAVLKAIRASAVTLAGAVSSSAMRIQRVSNFVSATIASGATNTGNIVQTSTALGGFIIPAAFTGTAVGFLVSQASTGHVPLCDASGSVISIPVVASRAYPLPPEAAAFGNLIIQSNAAEAAARTVIVVQRA